MEQMEQPLLRFGFAVKRPPRTDDAVAPRINAFVTSPPPVASLTVQSIGSAAAGSLVDSNSGTMNALDQVDSGRQQPTQPQEQQPSAPEQRPSDTLLNSAVVAAVPDMLKEIRDWLGKIHQLLLERFRPDPNPKSNPNPDQNRNDDRNSGPSDNQNLDSVPITNASPIARRQNCVEPPRGDQTTTSRSNKFIMNPRGIVKQRTDELKAAASKSVQAPKTIPGAPAPASARAHTDASTSKRETPGNDDEHLAPTDNTDEDGMDGAGDSDNNENQKEQVQQHLLEPEIIELDVRHDSAAVPSPALLQEAAVPLPGSSRSGSCCPSCRKPGCSTAVDVPDGWADDNVVPVMPSTGLYVAHLVDFCSFVIYFVLLFVVPIVVLLSIYGVRCA